MAVRVGLIGAGTMGRRHLDALSRDPRVQIVGVADAVEAAARAAASAVDARPRRDLGGLADLGIDALFVTLPNVYHGPVVLEALQRGLHVFSEKPMATSLGEGRQIVERVRGGDRVYQIGFNRRWAPAYRYLKQEVDAGFTPYSANVKMNDGDMLTPSWFTDVTVSGGFLYDTAVHLIDVVAWLVGPAEMVAALGRQSCYPDYDDIVLLLRCRGDRPVALTTCGHASWASPMERVELYGNHALLVSEDMDRARYATRDDTEVEWRRFTAPDALTLMGYVDEDRAFVDACLGLAPPPVTAEDAFHTLAVIDAAYTSLRGGGQSISVPAR